MCHLRPGSFLPIQKNLIKRYRMVIDVVESQESNYAKMYFINIFIPLIFVLTYQHFKYWFKIISLVQWLFLRINAILFQVKTLQYILSV